MASLKKTILFTSLSFLGLAVAPAALAGDSLEIRDFVGTIHWTNGPLSIDVKKNKGDLNISEGRRTTIDGGIDKIDSAYCKASYGRYDLEWFGKKKKGQFGGYKNLEDYPVLNITLPANTDLIIRDSVLFTQGKPDVAHADIHLNHCGSIDLGDVQGALMLENRGSVDVSVGDTGQIHAELRGSGDLTAGDTGEVFVKSHGSADVELGKMSSLELRLHGSGDFEAYTVSGNVDMASYGSGDIELGDVTGELVYSGRGSGDLDVTSVSGTSLLLETHGSGYIEIEDGEVENLTVKVSGSSSVDYTGETRTANLTSRGSGDISVDRVRVKANIKKTGSGDIDINQRG